jgi:precorrin-8X/cobalt-precorrin-8 methylmutase
MTDDNAKGGLKGRWGYELAPEEIEGESFRLIADLADLEQLTPAEVALVKRVIHATGDPLFSELVMWSPDAVARGVEAIKGGATIFTDVEMVRAGVSKVRAASFGCEVQCRLNDPEVVSEAREREMTRSAVAIERAVRQDPEAVFAFGNAPTALFRLLELMDEGVAKPKLIIGVVVGFVGAAESKDALMQRTDVNWISCKGNKGGSNVAAASVNALFKGAAGEV